MRRFSKKRAAQERRLRKIEHELRAEGQTHCFFFPHRSASSFDHIIPKSANTALIDRRENLVPISNKAHYIITFGTNKQIKELPNITRYLEKMKELDESYYKRFMTNHELWDNE
jgi:hypothetical protein